MPVTGEYTNATERNVREFIIGNSLFSVDDGSLKGEDSFLQNGKVNDHELTAMNLDSIQNVAAYVGRKPGS